MDTVESEAIQQRAPRIHALPSRRYVGQFGRLHPGLVDTIFRYNKRDQRGRYVATLAGTRPLLNGVGP